MSSAHSRIPTARHNVTVAEFGRCLRVKVASNGDMALAGAAEKGEATLMDKTMVGKTSSAFMIMDPGQRMFVAADAIEVHADFFAAADGKVSNAGSVKLGRCTSRGVAGSYMKGIVS